MSCCCRTKSERARSTHLRQLTSNTKQNYSSTDCRDDGPAFVCAVKQKHYGCANHIGSSLTTSAIECALVTLLTARHGPSPSSEHVYWLFKYAESRGIDVQQVFISHALMFRDPEMITWCVDYGLNPRYVNPQNGCSALYRIQCWHNDEDADIIDDMTYACNCRHKGRVTNIENIRKLIGYGVDVNHVVSVECLTFAPGLRYYQTAVENGIAYFTEAMFDAFVDAGFDIARHADDIFMAALRPGNGSIVSHVIKVVGRHLTAPDLPHRLASTDTWISVDRMGYILQKLRKWRIDLNRQDDNGWTPLHHAASRNRYNTIKAWILYAGANVHAVNHAGLKPIDLMRQIDDNDNDFYDARYFLEHEPVLVNSQN